VSQPEYPKKGAGGKRDCFFDFLLVFLQVNIGDEVRH